MTCLITIPAIALTQIGGTVTVYSFGSIALVYLLACIIIQEYSVVGEDSKLKSLGQHLSIGIIPLLFIFAFIMTMSVAEAIY